MLKRNLPKRSRNLDILRFVIFFTDNNASEFPLPLIDKTPEDTKPKIKTGGGIPFGKYIVTSKRASAEFEAIEVFDTQIGAE